MSLTQVRDVIGGKMVRGEPELKRRITGLDEAEQMTQRRITQEASK